ncbi:MAG: 23S rRNA (pseudouridine(1915)-N(3))-methyltransferase RlmH [Acidobacteria bacterium]|nr:23S rRNA (pseudouridine(1915)-N(3))-methyltransferase RlmH [Acidobacteriota bacterium]
MRLHLVWIGKTRDRNCAALVDDYLDRIRRFAPIDLSELKEQGSGSDEARTIAAESAKIVSSIERDDYVVVLDEGGRQLGSIELSELIEMRQQAGVKRMAFVIGGFAGVSQELKQRADIRLSLSRMTLTHEMARVILVEQIYRAFTVLAGMPYHKA